MATLPRIGLIGVGVLGARHAAALAGLAAASGDRAPALAFAGVYDLDPARAAAAARDHGTVAHESPAALFAACDGVVVAVPTVVHREVGEAALEGGCHLFIEKPIADSLEAADRLLAAARARKLSVFVGHSERFNPAVRAALPHLRAPRYVEARRLAGFSPRATDVDVVLDLMIHDIDLTLALLGERPAHVDAIGVAVLTPTEDLANARLEFPSGAVATLTASRVSPERFRKLRLFGEHAYITMDLLAGSAEAAFTDPGRLAEAAALFAQAAAHAAGRAPAPDAALPEWTQLVERRTLEAPAAGQPLALELEAFAAALSGATGEGANPQAPSPAQAPAGVARVPRLATGDDGRAALAVALEVRAAMRARAARFAAAR